MMAMMRCRALFAAALLLAAAGGVRAQGIRALDLKPMNFDLWCQETARLPSARCDRHTPEDLATFQAFRAKIEQYEIPYLQRKQNDIALDRNILNKDPVDNPIASDSQTQSLQQQRQPGIDTRTPQP